jgi:hypothetical protein
MRKSGDGSIGKSLGAENGQIEPSPETPALEGVYIARTVVRDRLEVPVRFLNAIRRDQKRIVSQSH